MILAAYAVIPKTAKQAATDRKGDRRSRGVDIEKREEKPLAFSILSR